MEQWHQDAKNWLSNEQSAANEAAEEAFARVFTALPAVEPSPAFVERTMAAAWTERARSRRKRLLLPLAAGLLLAVVSGFASYGIALDAGPSIVSAAAMVSSQTLVWLVSMATVVLDWWLFTARVSGGVSEVVTTPNGIAALAAIQLVAVGALYWLHRLLAGGGDVRAPRVFCF